MTFECRQTFSGPHEMTNDSIVKKQWAHTPVLETGVHPHPHKCLACSSRLGGGTETQESCGSPAQRGGAACFRVGSGQSKGEFAQRPGLFPPESHLHCSATPPGTALRRLSGPQGALSLSGSPRRRRRPGPTYPPRPSQAQRGRLCKHSRPSAGQGRGR